MKADRYRSRSRWLYGLGTALTLAVLPAMYEGYERERPQMAGISDERRRAQVCEAIPSVRPRAALAAVTSYLADFEDRPFPRLTTLLVARHGRSGTYDLHWVAEAYRRAFAPLRQIPPVEPDHEALLRLGLPLHLEMGIPERVDADGDSRGDLLLPSTHYGANVPAMLLRGTPQGWQPHLFDEQLQHGWPRTARMQPGAPPVFFFAEYVPVTYRRTMRLHAYQWRRTALRPVLSLTSEHANLYSLQDVDGDGTREVCLFFQPERAAPALRGIYRLTGERFESVLDLPPVLRPTGAEVWRPAHCEIVAPAAHDPVETRLLRRLDTVSAQLCRREFLEARSEVQRLTRATLAAPLSHLDRHELLSECCFYEALCEFKLGRPRRAAALLAALRRRQPDANDWAILADSRLTR